MVDFGLSAWFELGWCGCECDLGFRARFRLGPPLAGSRTHHLHTKIVIVRIEGMGR